MASDVVLSEGRLATEGGGAVAVGTIIAGAPLAEVAAASEAHALNSTFSDTEVEAALDALGVTVNALIARLVEAGIITVEEEE